MNDADDPWVEDALHRSLATAELDLGRSGSSRLDSTVARGRRLRRRRVGVNLLAAVVIAAAVIVPLASLLPLGAVKPHATVQPATPVNTATETTSPAPSVPADWVTYQLPAEGLSIQTPPRWHLVEDPLPALAHPHALIELSNYYMPLDPNSGCVPSNAVASLPQQDFVLWLEEWGSSGATSDAYPPRQDPFQLGKLAGYECIPRPAYVTPFSDQGRYFELFVVFGSNAPDSLRRSVIDSLDTLQVDPAGGRGPGPQAAPSWYAPPTFTAAPGWQTMSTSPDGSSLAHDAVPETWASNVPFAQADLASLSGNWLTGEFWPQQTIDGLSGDGVVMIADLEAIGYTQPIDGAVPVRTLPLDVHDETGPVEGGGQYVLWGAVRGQFIAVRFFYGPNPPTDAQLRAAQQELDNLVVPSLPPSG